MMPMLTTPMTMKNRKTAFVATITVLFFALLSGVAQAGDWPMFLKNASHDPAVEKAPQPPYRLKWSFATKGPVRSSPVISGGRLFIGSYDNSLYALDAVTGSQIWSFKTEGEILSTPAVYKDVVYFGSKDGNVYALAAATGKLVWKYETYLGVVTSPVVTDTLVLISSMDSYIYALSVVDGKRQWRAQMYDTRHTGVYSSPVLFEDTVYFASKNGVLYSAFAKSGGRNWAFTTSSAIYASPVIKDGTIYIVSYDRYLYALNAKTGVRLWKELAGNELGYASPVVANESVYQAFKSGLVKVYNKSTGKETASLHFPSGIKSTPVISSNGLMIFGGEDGIVYAANSKTGALLWQHKTGGPIHSSPAIVDDTIYIGSEDGTIYAFTP